MKKMILFILIPWSLFGQGGDGEFYPKKYIDSKTGDTVLTMFWKLLDLSQTHYYNFRLNRLNSTYSFDIQGTDLSSIRKGDSIWLKFAGGYTLTLFAKDDCKINKEEAAPPELTFSAEYYYAVMYDLPYQKLLALAGNEVQKVRIYSPHGHTDMNILPEAKPLIIKEANMIKEKRKWKVKDARVDSW